MHPGDVSGSEEEDSSWDPAKHADAEPDRASEDPFLVEESDDDNSSRSSAPSKARLLPIHQLIKKQDLEEFVKYMRPDECVNRDSAEAEEEKVAEAAVQLDRMEELCARDKVNRTPLHVALLNGYAEGVEKILEVAGPDAKKLLLQKYRAKLDDLPTLHLALSVAPFDDRLENAEKCIDVVLRVASEHEVDLVSAVDGVGRTALHLACDFGRASLAKRLLDKGADPFALDETGQLPLHFAIDSCDLETLRLMMERSKERRDDKFTWFHPVVRCVNRAHWVAIPEFKANGWMESPDVMQHLNTYAETHGLLKEWTEVLAACERGVPYEPEVQGSTLLVTHSDCFNHLAIPEDCDDPVLRLHLISQAVENPHRLEVITGEKGALRADEFSKDLVWRDNAPECPIGDILRVHEFYYIRQLSSAIERTGDPAFYADARTNKFKWVPFDRSDTKISADSWQAARRAAGCVLEAVDHVLTTNATPKIRNAFCALRPPGHHVGPNGAVTPDDVTRDDPNGSQGFCLLNNVAIGAAYARCVHRNVVRRIAIVDFDVHHGNGTEAICRNIYEKSRRPHAIEETRELHGMRVKFAAEAPASAKPWLDSATDRDCIFFASIHGYGSGFYPGSGQTEHCKDGPEVVNVGVDRGTNSRDLRELFHSHIIPPLLDFDPDLIFISAGFDGHSNDLIGCCRYNDEDYVWMTQELMKVANKCCKGRIVSVMEGGYNTRAGVLSPFASSVKCHLRTLMRTGDNLSFLNVDQPEVDWEDYLDRRGAYEGFAPAEVISSSSGRESTDLVVSGPEKRTSTTAGEESVAKRARVDSEEKEEKDDGKDEEMKDEETKDDVKSEDREDHTATPSVDEEAEAEVFGS